MSGFEISSMTNAKQKAWAQKCDTNRDGKIDENEISVFQQGVKSMYTTKNIQGCISKGQERVIIGGVDMPSGDVVEIKKNEEGASHEYSLTLSNGVRVNYDTQSEEADAKITEVKEYDIDSYNNGKADTATTIENFTDGRGVEVRGTNRNNDAVYIHNSRVSKIDGLAGKDHVQLHDCSGNPAPESEINAESVVLQDSFNFRISASSQRYAARPPEVDKPVVDVIDIKRETHYIEGNFLMRKSQEKGYINVIGGLDQYGKPRIVEEKTSIE